METICMVYKGTTDHLPAKTMKRKIKVPNAVEKHHGIKFIRDTGQELIFTLGSKESLRLQGGVERILGEVDFAFNVAFPKKVGRQIVIVQMGEDNVAL